MYMYTPRNQETAGSSSRSRPSVLIIIIIVYYAKGSTNIRTINIKTRSSADADNALDAFVGQSRSTNISGPFLVK